ncbi:flagellar basal-body rod protein FlgG [Paracoccaceae bacterium GXU_MW_L88]
MKALMIAATGMHAQQTRVEVTSNNLANMNTTAYNSRRAEFADLTYEQVQRPGAISASDGTVLPTGIQLGRGVRPVAVTMNVGQGAVKQTGGELDVAIEGNGYLEVTLPTGEQAFTRDGAMKVISEGQLVTTAGYPLVPDITIPEDTRAVTINANGEVYARFVDQAQEQLLGQLTLTTFVNEKGLEARGGNIYLQTEASGDPQTGEPGIDGRGTMLQGYLEGSTVDAVREITDLIEAQRGYELNAKVITAADQMLAATTQIR